MASRGKRYKEVAGLLERDARYEPERAIQIAKQTANARFDETIELHLRTGADPRYADQMVRGIAGLAARSRQDCEGTRLLSGRGGDRRPRRGR